MLSSEASNRSLAIEDHVRLGGLRMNGEELRCVVGRDMPMPAEGLVCHVVPTISFIDTGRIGLGV